MKLQSSLLARAAGLDCISHEAIDKLDRFAEQLRNANSKINLVSRSTSFDEEVTSQLALSLLPLHLSRHRGRWIDIGSGGGFPVVPLAIVHTEATFIAVEQIAKKAYFIERACQVIGLRNLRVVPDSIEEYLQPTVELAFDVVTVKAVTEFERTFKWAAALLRTGGILITYKPSDRISEDNSTLKKYGFEQQGQLAVKDLIDTSNLLVVSYKKL